ncbi:urate oxidase [Bacillus sp. A301a_S52]|nr:urate oxidase [Bacillus sp. A301a_S52]
MQTKAATRMMYYGKGDVFVYRTYAKPLTDVAIIPESSFNGRSNIILGMDVQVALKGDAFLTSFTEGDNSLVVATDSMKNFILHYAGEYHGNTMEGFLTFVGRKFLDKYSHIDAVDLKGRQFPFMEAEVLINGEVTASESVFREGTLEKPLASVEIERKEKGYGLKDHQSGVFGLHLIKVKGSSFAGYIKDEFTTLPETYDRPLFIYLNIYWRYKNPSDGEGKEPQHYVAAEHVKHIAQTVFHSVDSPSIQKLIFDIGKRILQRFPQLAEVSFESNNRTWETVKEEVTSSTDGKVFTDPRPPYGFQGFTMYHEDVVGEE